MLDEKKKHDHEPEEDESTGTPNKEDGALPPPADTNPPPH